MSKKTTRAKTLDSNRNLDMMDQSMMNQLIQQLATLQATMQTIQQENAELKNRLDQIPLNPMIQQKPKVLEPRVALYGNPDEINLEIFKSLSTFDGKANNYRHWREDAIRLMDSISQHINSNKYVEALTIVKSKITGSAADILLNHNTIFNFEAILNRLDYTYCDQRPLYVLKDELTKLTQGKSSLSEFHDQVSKALTVITSKISMSGDPPETIKCMTAHAMEDAVRTFKNGINNDFIRSTLYGNPIKDLEHAYAVAQTIEHDNIHKNIVNQRENSQHNTKQPQREYHQHYRRPSFRPFYQHQNNWQQLNDSPKPEPMDISSGNTKQIHQNDKGFHSQPWKRIREQSGNFNQNRKFQRNNRMETTQHRNDNSSTTTGISSKLHYKYSKHLN